ncbi:MAG: hypothetical protein ACKO9H_04000, partial [Planctomycetota bacterium]
CGNDYRPDNFAFDLSGLEINPGFLVAEGPQSGDIRGIRQSEGGTLVCCPLQEKKRVFLLGRRTVLSFQGCPQRGIIQLAAFYSNAQERLPDLSLHAL